MLYLNLISVASIVTLDLKLRFLPMKLYYVVIQLISFFLTSSFCFTGDNKNVKNKDVKGFSTDENVSWIGRLNNLCELFFLLRILFNVG